MPVPKLRMRPSRVLRKTAKRVLPLAACIYFIPWVLGGYVLLGMMDVLRNSRRTLSTLDRYFAGNGVFTWLLCPFNLLTDVLCLPYRNRGIYKLADMPAGHQAEIQAIIDAARDRNLVGMLEEKLGEKKRGMIFFKWYGKDLSTTVEMPEYQRPFKYIRTIGVSIFNKRASTGRHFGPLRITLRVLYNINDVTDPNVYIEVGDTIQRWRDEKLFIFDDTLQHQSVNESDGARYCLFLDILRPSPFPRLLSGILSAIRMGLAPFRAVFYKHWTILK